jgi:hypothetical protein
MSLKQVLAGLVPAALAAALLTIGPAAPASATTYVANRCQTYNHFGNPNLGSFVVCVWLNHATGAWMAAGDVQAIRGVRAIHHTHGQLTIDGSVNDFWDAGPANSYLSGSTQWIPCHGTHYFGSWISTWVTWSDGYESAAQYLNTGVTGSC